MIVYLNSEIKEIPEEVDTVGKLLDFFRIARTGTGVGINNRLVMAKDWDATRICPNDRLTVISATFGG